MRGEFSPQSAGLYAYGIYLMHGGTPEGFESLSETDIHIMLASYTCTIARVETDVMKGIARMFGRGED